MAEVKFYLEKRKDKATGDVNKGNVPILLFYSFNGKRLQYYTGYRIDAHKWDDGLVENKDGSFTRSHPGRVKKNFSEAPEINKELTKLISKVNDIHERADVLGERLTIQYFRDRLNDKKLDAKNSDPIWEAYEKYFEALKNTHTAKSIKNAKDTYKVLREFSKERMKTITFESVDEFFWQEFFDWCFNDKDYFNNYTGTHLNKIKAFLNWAVEKGYTKNLEFRKQPKMQEFIEIIYLQYEEVQKFYKHKFKDQTLAQVRDMYCLGCFTGLRYSDVIGLLPENIHEDKIVYRVKKTKEANIIPLNKFSRVILDRNKGKHPTHAMPQIKSGIHEYLRTAMKEVELDRMVQIVHYKGAERFEESAPLWKAATFHTSKKTFVTNFLERGGSLITAMAITGNKSHSVIKRYYKIADTFKAKEMARIFGK